MEQHMRSLARVACGRVRIGIAQDEDEDLKSSSFRSIHDDVSPGTRASGVRRGVLMHAQGRCLNKLTDLFQTLNKDTRKNNQMF
jgi:hypothetical protein